MEMAEKAVICPQDNTSVGPVKRKEFDIDDDISSFDLFCTKKYPKSTKGCCSNPLCRMFSDNCVGKRKIKRLKFCIEFEN